MLRTETQAKDCWCPMVRQPARDYNAPGVSVVNTDNIGSQTSGDAGKCVASKCMMWREVRSDNMPALGYCGLAGSTGLDFPA